MRQNQRTRVVAAGRSHQPNSPVNPPVDFTSTYRYQPGVEQSLEYAREGIPSFTPLEDLLAELEGGTGALVFSSGLAAASAVVNLLPLGAHLVIPDHAYMGFAAMAQQMADKGLLTLHRSSSADTDQMITTLRTAAAAAEAAGTETMLWIESPTNPMLEVADVPTLLAEANRLGATTAVDNTFATPLRQNPLAHGADVVVHSVTKFIAGHSDVVMGATITSDDEIHARLRGHRTMQGSVPGPLEVFLALRGARTLAVRLDAAERNAAVLAEQLEELSHDADVPLTEVTYPGLSSHAYHLRAKEQLRGFGAILTIDTGSAAAADAVLEKVQLWTPATSLGGVESLAERRRRHAIEPASVPEGLIRLSVGIEDAGDLYDDLVDALRRSSADGR